MEEGAQLLAGAVAADHADRNDPRAERGHVVRGVGGTAEPHVTLGESENDDGCLARDPSRLADEVLVGDDVADDDDRPLGKGLGNGQQPRCRHRHRRSIVHCTASSRSSATWSGRVANAWRRYSHSPRP